MAVYKIADYKGSREYRRLAEIAKAQSIICLVNSIASEDKMRHVARTIYFPGDSDTQESWDISARGIGYISAFGVDEFILECQRLDVEFIEPPRAA